MKNKTIKKIVLAFSVSLVSLGFVQVSASYTTKKVTYDLPARAYIMANKNVQVTKTTNSNSGTLRGQTGALLSPQAQLCVLKDVSGSGPVSVNSTSWVNVGNVTVYPTLTYFKEVGENYHTQAKSHSLEINRNKLVLSFAADS